MPTYDFRCPKGHVFEKFYRNMSDALLTLPCPQCDAVAKRQMSGGAGLVFKGSGFYSTDYGKNAHRKVASTAAGEGKSEGSGDSGSEARADSNADKAGSTTEPKSDATGEPKPAAPKAPESKSNSAPGKESGNE